MSSIGVYHRELQRLRAEFAKGKKDAQSKNVHWKKRSYYKDKGSTGPVLAVENLPDIQIPHMLLNRHRFLTKFAQALATGVKYRVSQLGIGADGGRTSRAFNSGGMWKGLRVRASFEEARIEFMKSSYPSEKVRKLKKAGGLEGLSRRKKAALRKRLALKKIKNSLKAKTVQKHINTEMLEPTQQELKATLEWLQQVIDVSLLDFRK